jgi:hypothetical protein
MLVINTKWVCFVQAHFISCIFVVFFACDSKDSEESGITYQSKDIGLTLDTIMISPSQTSHIGFFQVKGDAVYFVDQPYGLVEEFAVSGESKGIKKRELDGPEELQGISEVIPTKTGFIIRHEWVFYHYGQEWNFLRKCVLQFPSKESYDELMDNPKGEYIGMYELQNYNGRTVELPDGGLLTKLDVEHPIFNAFISRDYYRDGRILGKIDMFSGEVKEIRLNRPASYEGFSFVPFHNKFDYSVTTTNLIYVTHEIDSLIYVYDRDWKLKETFGAAGIDMKTDYVESQSIDVAFESKYFYHSRKNEGFYKDIFVDEENELIFRTYRKGSDRQDLLDETYNPLRLQVFKQGKLAGDHAVPGRFKILGKIGTQYIVDGFFDEQNEQLGFYILSLN